MKICDTSTFTAVILQILNLLIVRLVFSLTSNGITFSHLNYHFDYDFSFLYYNTTVPSKCFAFTKSLKYDPEDQKSCVDRGKNKKYLPCGIGISPNMLSAKQYVAVFGSTGTFGLSVVSEFRRNNIDVTEIRSHFQFDISNNNTYQILDNAKISAIVLFANDEIWPQINFSYSELKNFSKYKKIPVFQIVKEFDTNNINNFIQIKSGPIWGPIYLTPHQRVPGKFIYQCIANETIDVEEINSYKSELFTYSFDAANYIVAVVNKTINEGLFDSQFRKKKYIIPKFEKISISEIESLLIGKGCKFNDKVEATNLKRISLTNKKRFHGLWESVNRKRENVYASLVICASDTKRIIYLFSIVLQTMNIFIKKYPNLPFELVVVYCPSEKGQKRFHEIFKCPKRLKKYVTVIEISQSFVKKIKSVHNITYFPEFDIKNIGIRRAKGEYVFTGNSDIVLPIGFFECVQRELFSPLSYIRTHRIMTRFIKPFQLIDYYEKTCDNTFLTQKFTDVCSDSRYYDNYDRNGCGDFQGAHNLMWKWIDGFLESEYVFHVDATVSLDFSALPVSIFSRGIGTNLHLVHPKQSKMTEHFRFYDDWFKNAIRQGVSSCMIPNFRRPNWGAKGETFLIY